MSDFITAPTSASVSLLDLFEIPKLPKMYGRRSNGEPLNPNNEADRAYLRAKLRRIGRRAIRRRLT